MVVIVLNYGKLLTIAGDSSTAWQDCLATTLVIVTNYKCVALARLEQWVWLLVT